MLPLSRAAEKIYIFSTTRSIFGAQEMRLLTHLLCFVCFVFLGQEITKEIQTFHPPKTTPSPQKRTDPPNLWRDMLSKLRRLWRVIALQRTMAGPSTWTSVLVVMTLLALFCSYLVEEIHRVDDDESRSEIGICT